jgi:ABC transporter transmembrane region
MWSRAVRIRWRHLFRFQETGPVVLLFEDGTAGLLTGANGEQHVVYIRDPFTPAGTAPIAVDELRLSEAWAGEAVLLRTNRGYVATDAPFNFRWLVDLVLQERRSTRDIGLASLTVSILTIFPPILVMTMVNKVMQFHSVSTLILLSSIMIVVWVYETFLGYARRAIIAVVGARLDTKLNLHLFGRLLRLPLDYFERHPAGETMYQVAQVYRVREFLTGQLLATFQKRSPHRHSRRGNVRRNPSAARQIASPAKAGAHRSAARASHFLVSHTIALDVREHGTMGPGFRRDGNGGIVRHRPEPVLGPAAGRTWGPVRREGEHQYHLGRSTENIRSVISVSPW